MFFPKTTFSHHDLNSGLVATVNRVHEPGLKDELDRAIIASHKTRNVILIGGGKFELFADLTTVNPDGTAYFFVAAGAPLGDGQVPVGATLYDAVAASLLATAPNAWRHVFKRYLANVSNCTSPDSSWSAPGPMPRGTPWLTGFSSSPRAHLLREEKVLLWKLVRLVGLNVLERCEHGAAEAALEGNIPEIDPGRYIELGDWQD